MDKRIEVRLRYTTFSFPSGNGGIGGEQRAVCTTDRLPEAALLLTPKTAFFG